MKNFIPLVFSLVAAAILLAPTAIRAMEIKAGEKYTVGPYSNPINPIAMCNAAYAKYKAASSTYTARSADCLKMTSDILQGAKFSNPCTNPVGDGPYPYSYGDDKAKCIGPENISAAGPPFCQDFENPNSAMGTFMEMTNVLNNLKPDPGKVCDVCQDSNDPGIYTICGDVFPKN